LLALLAGVLLVLLRLHVAEHGDISRFVVAGRTYVNPARAPAGLHVYPNRGYDGQMYYRIALDPWDMRRTAFGIRLDNPDRLQRVGYPALSWLFSLTGRPADLPWAMVVVNLLGLALLGWVGGLLARDGGRHACLGLALPAYFGFAFTLARDTTEITEAAFATLGIVCWSRRRYLAAAAAFSAAVLSRETSLYLVGALAVCRLILLLRRRARPGAPDAAWICPGLVFAGWQLVVLERSGHLAVDAGARGNLAAPFTGLAAHVGGWFTRQHSPADLLLLAEAATLLLVVVLVLASLRTSQAPAFVRLGYLFTLALTVSLAAPNWVGFTDFRNISFLHVLGMPILFRSQRALLPLTVLLCLLWCAAAVLRIRAP
jgi:hypothetical protein